MLSNSRNFRSLTVGLISTIVATACTIFMVCLADAADSPNYRDRYTRPNISSRKNPTTSPYLNLLRNAPGSSGFASDYFLRVRPEQEWRRQNEQFGRSLQGLQRQLNGQQPSKQQSPFSTIGPTGHPTSFSNLSHYYPGGK